MLLTELMIRAAKNERYPPHVREVIQTWVETSFRFNSWFLEVGKARHDEEPFTTIQDEDTDAFKALRAALERYRSYPKGKNEEQLLAAIQDSIRIRTKYLGDWKPKDS